MLFANVPNGHGFHETNHVLTIKFVLLSGVCILSPLLVFFSAVDVVLFRAWLSAMAPDVPALTLPLLFPVCKSLGAPQTMSLILPSLLAWLTSSVTRRASAFTPLRSLPRASADDVSTCWTLEDVFGRISCITVAVEDGNMFPRFVYDRCRRALVSDSKVRQEEGGTGLWHLSDVRRRRSARLADPAAQSTASVVESKLVFTSTGRVPGLRAPTGGRGLFLFRRGGDFFLVVGRRLRTAVLLGRTVEGGWGVLCFCNSN